MLWNIVDGIWEGGGYNMPKLNLMLLCGLIWVHYLRVFFDVYLNNNNQLKQLIIPMQQTEQRTMVPYETFLSLLSRAKTYDHLIFYNRRLINCYLLAAHGFVKSVSREGHEQAKCISCGCCFLLDPIVEVETMQIKQTFNQVIRNHQQNCKFGTRDNAGNKIIKLSRVSIIQYGTKLCLQLIKQNSRCMLQIQQKIGGKVKWNDIFNPRQMQMLKNLAFHNNTPEIIYLVSLFGWRINSSKTFQCEYCGINQLEFIQFNTVESHRSHCAVIREGYWETILEKLAMDSLQGQNAEIVRTEGALRAKKLREQLQNYSSKTFDILNRFRLKVIGIKEQIVNLDDKHQEDELISSKFRKIGSFADNLQQYIKNGIKKVKIQ